MSLLEFALALVVILAMFLGFVLALLVTVLGNIECRSTIRELFQIVLKTLAGFLS